MQIPLFPLHTVLFPGGTLPLQIFEVRYLDMIGRCRKAGTPFGVVCLTEGSEVRRRARAPDGAGAAGGDFAREAFYPVGTLAAIDELQRPLPGLLAIRCIGGQRFRLRSTELLRHGLWTGEAETIADDPAVALPADMERFKVALQRLLPLLQARSEPPGEPRFAPPCRWDDCGWLANRWCELLPIALAERQRLMELENPLLRLELVADLLERFDPGAESEARP